MTKQEKKRLSKVLANADESKEPVYTPEETIAIINAVVGTKKFRFQLTPPGRLPVLTLRTSLSLPTRRICETSCVDHFVAAVVDYRIGPDLFQCELERYLLGPVWLSSEL